MAASPIEKKPAGLPIRAFVSLLIGAALAYMMLSGGLPLLPDRAVLTQCTGSLLWGYVLSLLGVHFFRAVRWRHLLRPIGQVSARQTLSSCFLGFAAIMFFPLRSGEVARPLLLARYGKIRAWEAAGSVGAERVIDGLTLSVVLFVALQITTPLDPLPKSLGDLALPVAAVPIAAYGALLLFVAAMAIMALMYVKRALAQRLIIALVGWLSRPLADKISTTVGRVARGLDFLPSGKHLRPFLLETAVYWFLNAMGLWLLAQGCGLNAIGPAEACVVMGCLGIGVMLPSAPGYFGTFQLSNYLALAMFLPEEAVLGPGSAFVAIAFGAQLTLHVCGAVLGALLGTSEPAAS